MLKSLTALNRRMALKIEILICWVRDLLAVDYTSCDTIASSICRSDNRGHARLVNKFLFRKKKILPVSGTREENSVVAVDRDDCQLEAEKKNRVCLTACQLR